MIENVLSDEIKEKEVARNRQEQAKREFTSPINAESVEGISRSDEQRKILIVSHYMPPMKNVGGLRMDSLSRYLIKQGDEVAIITGATEGDFSQFAYCAQIRILDASSNIIKKMFRFSSNQNVYVNAFRKAMKRFHPDVIIISGGPYYTFEIVSCAKEYDIPCILDYRDPWLEKTDHLSIKEKIRYFIIGRMESRYISLASRVVTVTDGWKNDLIDRFSLYREKIVVIENGYDDEKLKGIKSSLQTNELRNEMLNLFVFGKMFTYTERYSRMFLEAYQFYKDSIKLTQVGEREPATDNLMNLYGIDDSDFVSTGFVDYRKGIELLNTADAFLIVDDRKDALGTKIYDYIYLNKPIIFVGPSDCAIAYALRDFKNAFLCENPERLRIALERLFDVKGSSLDADIEVQIYSRSSKNRLWSKLIEEVIKQ